MNKRWKVLLSEAENFNLFVDILTPSVRKIEMLPMATANVLINYISDVINGIEIVDDEELELITCYFMIAVLLSKRDSDLYLTQEDFEKIPVIASELGKSFALLENVLTENMDVKMKDGLWDFNLTRKGENLLNMIEALEKLDDIEA